MQFPIDWPGRHSLNICHTSSFPRQPLQRPPTLRDEHLCTDEHLPAVHSQPCAMLSSIVTIVYSSRTVASLDISRALVGAWTRSSRFSRRRGVVSHFSITDSHGEISSLPKWVNSFSCIQCVSALFTITSSKKRFHLIILFFSVWHEITRMVNVMDEWP